MSDLLELLSGVPGQRPFPLFVHAHPDDETLQTGALLAWLTARHVDCVVLTCTRGERGEIVPGVLPSSVTAADLVRVRQRELACAIGVLGVGSHYYLGTPPARAHGLTRRDYRDSGMRWLAPGLAGPVDEDDPAALTAASLDDELADLLALVQQTEASVLVGYDDLGSYGHPDHLRAHELTRAAAKAAGLAMIEVASTPEAAGFDWFDLADERDTVVRALGCYATQLQVNDDHLVHVGGQRQELPLRVGLRRAY